MKAVVLKEFGGPENLSLGDLPIPSVEPGTVLIRAVAASVNPADISISKGTPFSPVLPAVLGCDIAGVIVSVGDGVTGLAPGDEVFGCVGGVRGSGGTLAEYVLADARLLARKPQALSMREAAALPLVAITAHEGMDRAGVSSAHHVLVHGGTGGVGHVAVQIAAARGAKVATRCPQDRSKRPCASAPRPQSTTDRKPSRPMWGALTGGAGFDVVFDTLGGPHLEQSFQAAKTGGQIVSTIALAQLDLRPMHLKGLSLHVIFMLLPLLTGDGRERHGAILREVATLADEDKLRPLVDESRFTLATAADACQRLRSGDATGKVVIDTAGTTP